MTDKVRDILIVSDSQAYGEGYRDHCLEIYKLYVGMADKISARRQSANSFFLAVNTGLIGVFGYFKAAGGGTNLFVFLAGMVLCFAWYRLLRSYKDMNTGKFKVIHEMEKELPFSPYDAEWEALGRGENPKLYLQFTRVEMWVPWIFGGLYAVLLLFVVPWSKIGVAACSWIQ